MTKPTASVYPGTLDSAATLLGDPVDRATFTLAGDITVGSTSFAVNESISAVNMPTFLAFNSGEIIFAETKVDGTKTFGTLTRGDPAQSHLAGEVIRLALVSDYIKLIKSAIIAIETELGTDPAGAFTNVKSRLTDIEGDLSTGITTHDHSGGANGVVVNADQVDGIHATSSPTANRLLALNGSAKLPASITGDADTVDGKHVADLMLGGFPTMGAASYVSIATGAITVASPYSKYAVNTESSGVADDLDTISGGTTGQVLALTLYNSARRVVIKHGTGNIILPNATDIDIPYNAFTLLWYDGSSWFLMGARDDTRYIQLTNKSGQALVEGDVMIFDKSNDVACTTTTTASDPRIMCVAAHAIASNAKGNFIATGIGKVNTTGTVDRGNALVTSTSAKLAKGMPGSIQQGLLGYALTASSANQCTAFIMPKLDRAGSAVAIEGVGFSTNGGGTTSLAMTSVNLVCGSSPNRVIIGFGMAGCYYGVPSNFPVPVAAGTTMSALTTLRSDGANRNASEQVYWQAFYMVAPPTGTVNITIANVTIGDANGIGAEYMFIALSGVNQGTPYRTAVTSITTTQTPAVSCTDAVAGDLVVAIFSVFGDLAPNYIASGRGSGQTKQIENGGSFSGNRNDTWMEISTEVAASGTEQSTWTNSTGATIQRVFTVPVVPA